MMRQRSAIAALVLSAAGLISIVAQEGYTDRATIPTQNDRPTVGFGSTFRDDGAPVQLGDTIKPVPALQRSLAHIEKDEAGLKRCVSGPMHQAEYDILVDFAYQYGTRATCASSMVRHINTGNYPAACHAYTLYKYSGGFDCTIPGNKVCAGVWTRNLARRDACLEAGL